LNKHQRIKPIRIQLAEDHEMVRSGFRYLLNSEEDMEVVAESATGLQAGRDFERYKPDVLVMGLSLPDMNGLIVVRHILNRYPEARILVLSMYSGPVAEAALQQGALGFISKQCGVRDLIMGIRKIMRGERFIDPETAEQLKRIKEMGKEGTLSSLTKRELEVFRFLANGQSVSSIAKLMHLSEKTIYTHREHILNKLCVKSVSALTQITLIMNMFSDLQ
jgi:two-component system, NarL family, invasion response regulator UvrY